jgi:hypothetical protein
VSVFLRNGAFGGRRPWPGPLALAGRGLGGSIIPVPPGPDGGVPQPPEGYRLWAIQGRPFFMSGTYWAIPEE